LKAVQGLPVFSSEMTSLEGGPGPEVLVRFLDIRTLAERVFGDGEKAEAWLTRPNSSLSGQRPLDLLKDELGTAVVREMLERIDHGILPELAIWSFGVFRTMPIFQDWWSEGSRAVASAGPADRHSSSALLEMLVHMDRDMMPAT
jgi:hypothetical protein